MVAIDGWARYQQRPLGALWLLEGDAPTHPEAARPIPARESDRGRTIVCANCGLPITNEAARISVQEAHEHRFMNPAGLLFHIGCFAHAAGCRVIGPASEEYPWFPGFAWRLALCGGCADHLGWQFQAREGASFFGLRLDHLRVVDEASPPEG